MSDNPILCCSKTIRLRDDDMLVCIVCDFERPIGRMCFTEQFIEEIKARGILKTSPGGESKTSGSEKI